MSSILDWGASQNSVDNLTLAELRAKRNKANRKLKKWGRLQNPAKIRKWNIVLADVNTRISQLTSNRYS